MKNYDPRYAGSFGEELSYWHYYCYSDFLKSKEYKTKKTISKKEFSEWNEAIYKKLGTTSYTKLIEKAHKEISNNNLNKAIEILYHVKEIIEIRWKPDTVIFSVVWFELAKTYFIKKSYQESKYYLFVYKELYPYLIFDDFIINQNWESYFLRCLVNLFLENQEDYKIVLNEIISQKNKSEFTSSLDKSSSQECYSYFHFLQGFESIYKKQENKIFIEEFEKVIKNSPNFFKDNDYLLVHIPEEIKSILSF